MAVLELEGRGGGAQEEDGGDVGQEGGGEMHFWWDFGLVAGTGMQLNEWIKRLGV